MDRERLMERLMADGSDATGKIEVFDPEPEQQISGPDAGLDYYGAVDPNIPIFKPVSNLRATSVGQSLQEVFIREFDP